jgi:hypothetical protein
MPGWVMAERQLRHWTSPSTWQPISTAKRWHGLSIQTP